jgi:hypothetical protein
MLLEDLERISSAVSAVIAASALLATMKFSRRGEVRAVRPVMVIVYKEDGWHIANVGQGPALDVMVAKKVVGGGWIEPVRVPPIAKDAEFRLHWMAHDNTHGIGVSYSSFSNEAYTSICGNDKNKLSEGNLFPDWTEKQIAREWALRNIR